MARRTAKRIVCNSPTRLARGPGTGLWIQSVAGRQAWRAAARLRAFAQ
jgi:hypothetical protein